MTLRRKILLLLSIVIATPILIFVGFWTYAFIYYEGRDNAASFDFAHGHKLQVYTDRHWDSFYCALCKLSGPTLHHEPVFLHGISSSDAPPRYTWHSSTNRQIFWLTADTDPLAALYILDLDHKDFWPAPDKTDQGEPAQRLLALINSEGVIYHQRGDPPQKRTNSLSETVGSK